MSEVGVISIGAGSPVLSDEVDRPTLDLIIGDLGRNSESGLPVSGCNDI